jgi:beta-barrel assembly-enhancing protease
MSVSATYFDGRSARDHSVMLEVDGINLVFSGPDVAKTNWKISGLHPVDAPSPGQPFRLTHDETPGARLIVKDADFIAALIATAPHLKGGYSKRDIGNIFGWTLGGLLAVAALGYACMTLLPDRVAKILPDSWRNRVGKEMELAVVEGARVCSTPKGDAALSAMINNLAQGAPDLPPIGVHIYDVPILNAFAVPGGNIIMTRELIEKADAPEEVAGVLAHEIGHVYYRHPEAQLVRLTGMQVLSSVFTGSKGGNMSTNLAFLATLLQYSRNAEAEADAYARETMVKASIDPMGLKTFFEKIQKLEGDAKISKGAFTALGNLFSTHPGTEDRIKLITPLPTGQTANPVLTAEEWQALKHICEK